MKTFNRIANRAEGLVNIQARNSVAGFRLRIELDGSEKNTGGYF